MSDDEFDDVEVKPGDVLAGKYRVDRVLGAGGMGVVVQATHTVLNDRVALKFLLPHVLENETTAARFLREAQSAVRIKSNHVARVVDVGTLDTGSPYMVMEFLEGKDLGAVIESEGPLEPPMAVLLALQTCEALAAAHAAGIVHRDIKPANLFITQAGDGSPVLKVLDFGISKVTGPDAVGTLTQTQVSMGSPLYMSPEQMRSARDVDQRTDVWSLGVVLYEMLTAELPFVAESMPQLCALVLETTAPAMTTKRPELPAGLDEIVLRCLEKDLDKRFGNVADLARALGPFAGESGIASAERTSRILEGAGQGKSWSQLPRARDSMASLPAMASTSGALKTGTNTAFGNTQPATSATESGGKRGMLYAVGGLAALAVIGVGAFVALGDSGATAAPETAIDPAAAAASAPPPEPEPSETAKPEAEQPEAEKAEADAGAEEAAEKKADPKPASRSHSRPRSRPAPRSEPQPKAEPKPKAEPQPKPDPQPSVGVFDERK